MKDNQLIVPVKNGHLVATISPDPNYPGIDVEFVCTNDMGETASRPRVLIEQPFEESTIRALIWNNPESEDYTEEIELYVEEEKENERIG